MTSLNYYNTINALLLRIAVDIACYDNHDVESHLHVHVLIELESHPHVPVELESHPHVPVELESHLHIPVEVLGFESCVHTNCMLCLHKHT